MIYNNLAKLVLIGSVFYTQPQQEVQALSLKNYIRLLTEADLYQ